MLEQTVSGLLAARFPQAEIDVILDGNHCQVRVVSDEFDGKRAVKRQQQVYAVLNDKIASGEIHAVHLQLLTPAEAAARTQ